jgi:hypothetical protein
MVAVVAVVKGSGGWRNGGKEKEREKLAVALCLFVGLFERDAWKDSGAGAGGLLGV